MWVVKSATSSYDGGDFDNEDNSFEFGVLAGADAQFGNFVLGARADWNWIDLERGVTIAGDSYDLEVTNVGSLSAILQQADANALAASIAARVAAEAEGRDGDAAANAAAEATVENFINPRFDIRTRRVPSGEGADPIDFPHPFSIFSLDDVLGDLSAGTVTEASGYTESLEWYGTLRGRAGITSGRMLFYGTGGLAYGNVNRMWSSSTTYDEDAADLAFGDTSRLDVPSEYDLESPDPADIAALEQEFLSLTDFNPGDGDVLPEGCSANGSGTGATVSCTEGESENDVRFGWALGAGVEFMATEKISIGAEYLYVNINGGSGDDDFGDSVESLFDINDDEDFDFSTVKLTAAYRF